MKDLWKTIPAFELYEASNTGKIRSKARVVIKSDGRKYTVVPKVMKPAKDGSGYLRTAFSVNGELTTIKVHRMIMMAFDCRDDYGSLEVNHINGIKTDNRVENLEWCTKAENIRHSFESGLQDRFLEVARQRVIDEDRKLNKEKYLNFMNDYYSGIKAPTLAKKYELNKKTAYQIVKGVSYKELYKDYQAKRSN